jgi:hypothetical protein
MTCGVYDIYLKFGSFNGIDPIVPFFYVPIDVTLQVGPVQAKRPVAFGLRSCCKRPGSQ